MFLGWMRDSIANGAISKLPRFKLRFARVEISA